MAAPLTVPAAGLVEGLLAAPAGGSIEIGRVTLRLSPAAVHIGLRDVMVRAPGIAASVSQVVLTQRLSGRFATVEEPLVRIDPVALGGGAARLPDPRDALRALDAALAGAGETFARRGVREVTVAGGRLEVVSSGRPITEARVFQDVTAIVAGGPDFSVSLGLVGAGGRVDASLRRAAVEGGSVVRAEVAGLVPDDLAALAAVESGFPLAAVLDARFSDAGGVEAASATIEVGEGVVIFGPDPPRTLDEARIALSLSPSGSILVEEGEVLAGGTRVPFTGAVSPGEAPGAPWTFTLASRGALLDPPDLDEPSVVVERADAYGSLDLAARRVVVERMSLEMAQGRGDAVLTFDFSDGPRLSGAARIGPAAIGALRAVWPPILAHGPRMATLGTVLGGFVEGVDIDLALTPLELDGDPTTHDMIEGGLTVETTFRDATLAGKAVPVAVRRARGTLSIRDTVLTARLDGGIVGVDGHDLDVVEATFEIPAMHERPPTATLRAIVEGPLSAVVAIANRVGIEQLEKFALTPADVTGSVRAQIWLETPLADGIPLESRRWSIDALLTGAGASVPLAGRKVENANLEVVINSRRIAARGRAVIDGLALDVNYSELFAGGRSGAARFVLTDEERRRRGIDTGGMLRGPVVVTVEADDDERRSFTADFTEAEIALPVFAKAAGRSLVAEGVVVGDGGAMQLQDLRLEGSGAELAGALMVSGGALEWAALDTVAFSSGDIAQLNVESKDGGGYRIDLDAERLDARRLVRSFREGGGESSGGPKLPVTLRARAGQLRLSDDAVAGDVSLDAVYDGTRLRRLSLAGRLDGVGEGSFAARIAPGANGSRDVRAEMRELGRLLAAFDLYGRMDGGRTTVEARLDQDGVLVGRMTVRDFALTNERTLDAVIARARTAHGAADERNPLPLAFQGTDGSASIPFEGLVMDFEKRGSVVRITEAILRGPVMGGTVEGTVDLSARTVALNGTFIPAYGVNNLFGRLPLFGEILGGGDTGGLIGVTFRLAGPMDDPQLLLNPISAIAPGIFRRIFEFR